MIRKLSLMLNLSNTHEESYSASDVLRSRGFFGCQVSELHAASTALQPRGAWLCGVQPHCWLLHPKHGAPLGGATGAAHPP